MRSLILFARVPRLGSVKTRLEPALGAERALALHTAFVADQARFLGGFARDGVRVEISLDGRWPGAPDPVAALSRTTQGDGDLGVRLRRAFLRAVDAGTDSAVILGADAPTLPRDRVDRLFAALEEGADASLVPAADGGYVAIGIRGAPPPALFEGVPWGTEGVLAATAAAAARERIRLVRTDPWFDVDRPEDLTALAASCLGDPDRAPETLALVRKWGIDGAGTPMV